jgi:hypothetical protein
MIDVNLKGTLYTRGHAPSSDRVGRGRLRVAGERRRRARLPGRGRLQRVEVRAGRVSRARSTTSCARRACAPRTSPPAACTPSSRSARGASSGDPALAQMMSAEDVAESCSSRSRVRGNLRILTTTFRPMSEGSFG